MYRNRSLLAALLLITAASAAKAESPTLREIMVQLGKEMHGVSDGILVEDWVKVAAAARAVADHPRPPMGERMRILSGLGDEAAGFQSGDKAVHDQATALAAAAESGQSEAVLDGYARLLEGCMACHAEYRERVRDLTRR